MMAAPDIVRPAPVRPLGLLWGIAGLLAVGGLLSPNPWLTAACVLLVPLLAQLLWHPGSPPILLMVVLYQWLQVATRVLHADLAGKPVGELADISHGPVGTAVVLGLAAVLVLAVGQRLAMGRIPPASHRQLEGDCFSPVRLFLLYSVLTTAGEALLSQGWRFLPLMQAFVAIAQLKWVALFALAHLTFARRARFGWLVMAVVMEVIIGFGGYFSGFKTVFVVLILAALSAGVRITARQALVVVVMASAVFGLSLIWMGIREEYRAFLRQGETEQVIRVTWKERLREVSKLAGALDASMIGPALERGLLRIAYVDYFADALAHVPAVKPHAEGEIWVGAVRHVLLPRMLFPDKPVLPSDSELTRRYTGNRRVGLEQGTSISLGYVAESYVDFGLTFMWVPILLMGVLQGWICRFFVRGPGPQLLCFGFAATALMPSMIFETTAIKYLGGTLYLFIVLGLVARLVVPRVASFLSATAAYPAGGHSGTVLRRAPV